MNTKISTDQAPAATGPFSQAIKSGNLIFTSGQIPLDVNGKMIEGTIQEKTHQIMKNLQNILSEAGCSFSNVVKTTIYVTDMSIYTEINEVYGSYFSDPFPARETVCVKELPLSSNIEISMIAVAN